MKMKMKREKMGRKEDKNLQEEKVPWQRSVGIL
jgi:hypothetical protein